MEPRIRQFMNTSIVDEQYYDEKFELISFRSQIVAGKKSNELEKSNKIYLISFCFVFFFEKKEQSIMLKLKWVITDIFM